MTSLELSLKMLMTRICAKTIVPHRGIQETGLNMSGLDRAEPGGVTAEAMTLDVPWDKWPYLAWQGVMQGR